MADTDQGRQRQQSRTTGILKAGTPAPEFTLNATPDQPNHWVKAEQALVRELRELSQGKAK